MRYTKDLQHKMASLHNIVGDVSECLECKAYIKKGWVCLECGHDNSDYHTELAARTFKIKPSEVTKKQRTQAKNDSFARNYGRKSVKEVNLKVGKYRDLNDKEMVEVRRLKNDQGLCMTIKYVRKINGMGLRDAKVFVDGLVTLD